MPALAAVAVSRPAPARAAVVEPNGTSVPATVNNGETTLQAYFTAQGETINAVTDASTDPGAFLPLCDFQATLVLSQSGAYGGIAWYNTTAGATGAPAAANIYQIGGFPLTVGMTITSTDVRASPNYAGGLIGFALQKKLDGVNLSNVYYSEYRRNANCTGCTGAGMTPGYWKMALAYRSTKLPKSYYLAFEDWEGADASSWQGNDGDFNDKVFRIDGVICQGGGMPCDTGMQGVCAQGVTECQVGAGIMCKPAIRPTTETCDNLDNDCDGMVDNNAPCPQANYVCSKGVCIPKCDDSEFPCGPGFQCDTDGLCKDPRCATIDCPAGQVCQNGACVGGCAGVTCPLGQVCQLGVCVDPCAGVSCPIGDVCDKGACVTGCACRACGAGQICVTGGPLDGQCVDTGCDSMTCPAGTFCRKGSCDDACTGAVCPGGQGCHNGMCDPVPPNTPTGMGGTSGGTGGAGGGFVIVGSGGTTGSGTGGSGGSSSGSAGSGLGGGGASGAGATGAAGGTPLTGRGGTCACEVAAAPGPTGLGLLLAAAALVGRRRRRCSAAALIGAGIAIGAGVYFVMTAKPAIRP